MKQNDDTNVSSFCFIAGQQGFPMRPLGYAQEARTDSQPQDAAPVNPRRFESCQSDHIKARKHYVCGLFALSHHPQFDVGGACGGAYAGDHVS